MDDILMVIAAGRPMSHKASETDWRGCAASQSSRLAERQAHSATVSAADLYQLPRKRQTACRAATAYEAGHHSFQERMLDAGGSDCGRETCTTLIRQVCPRQACTVSITDQPSPTEVK